MSQTFKLFIDTSLGLSVGLLDDKYSWHSWYQDPKSKMSNQVHQRIYDFLTEKSLSFDFIPELIISAGPGSYTGMRMTSGMGEVFELLGKKIVSFYHFEIPCILGIEDYCWCAKAFKGEYFVAIYKKASLVETKLIKAQDLSSFAENYRLSESFFWHLKDENDSQTLAKDKESLLLLHKEAPKLFKKVCERAKNFAPYYFRSVDQEFKRPSL